MNRIQKLFSSTHYQILEERRLAQILSSNFKQPDACPKTRVIAPGLSAPGLATWCSRAFSSKSPRQIVASGRPRKGVRNAWALWLPAA